MDKHLHIVCLNVPYPVDYGGVFDLFYKLPALYQQGVKIHLHCFQYGRPEQEVLNRYCESVHYYKRKSILSSLSLKFPLIVSSRKNELLLKRLLKDDYPILMEGIHCTYLLNDSRFNNRKCFVRLHNVEHIYYKHLYNSTSSLTKKIYFYFESKALLKYEKAIAGKATFWSVTEKDAIIYEKLGCKKVSYLPLFLPPWKLSENAGKGTFCLYHGDLSVAENEKAVLWLIEKVFKNLEIPFVIAGKKPGIKIIKKAHENILICLIADPVEEEMQDLISKAHINIIPSYNSTGIKLKLLNALFNGRHCVVNHQTIEGTPLEDVCHVVENPEEFRAIIQRLYHMPYDHQDYCNRFTLLHNLYNNETNAKWITELIWPTLPPEEIQTSLPG